MSRMENDYHNANLLADDDDDDEIAGPAYSKPITDIPDVPSSAFQTSTPSIDLADRPGGLKRSPPPPQRKPPQLPGQGRFVVGIDYGTTYTGLAYATTHSEQADLSSIEVLQNWAVKMNNQQKVRSVISYAAPVRGEAQWGSDISDTAVTMVNTKLELEPLPTRFDELDLTLQVLTGTGCLDFGYIRRVGPEPAYTTKEPAVIVSDYLERVLQSFRKAMDLEQLARTNTPVDIVVTVPVDWSYEAHKSMFQAIRKAGFDQSTFPTLTDIMLVTEPEAASYFTSRDVLTQDPDTLRVNDCFILCDAGGGTVDVISFQVKEVTPHLVLEKVTKPSGGNHGSSLIDSRFKAWLRSTIGRDNYAKLDPANAKRERISAHTAETGPMRKVLQTFFDHKSTFSTLNKTDIKLTLPAPLNDLSMDGVKQGELTIPWAEMARLMDPCVNGVVELIKDQIVRVVESRSRRIRNVFLVGGFGASPYLQELLKKSLALRKIKLNRPKGIDDNHADPSLTAVVQGAVIYGIEKARHKDASFMTAAPKSFGVLHDGRFEWLIKKGDLVLSKTETSIESRPFWHSIQACTKNKFDFVIYTHLERGDDDDDLPELWQNGQHDVRPVGYVKCDFSNMIDRDSQPLPEALMPGSPSGSQSKNKIGPLTWRLRMSSSLVAAEILSRGSPLAKCEIQWDSGGGRGRRMSTHSVDSLEAFDRL